MIRLTAVIEIEGQAPKALTFESNARSIILGRDDSADFSLPLATISRHHARILESDGVFTIEDLGSTHGTKLNGKSLTPDEKSVLRHGDILEMTHAKLTCAIEESKLAHVEPGEGTQAIAAKAVQGILGRLGDAHNEGPYLRQLTGPAEGTRYPLVGGVSQWTLGRSHDCECVVDDVNVSRRHAIIRKDWHGYILEDLGSKNGVQINEKLVRGKRRLKDHDEVTIGPIKLVFVDPDAELLSALESVPGFEPKEPTDDDDVDDVPPDDAPAASDVEPPPPEEAEADELADLDPSLLEAPAAKPKLEWAILGGLGLLALAAAAGLYFVIG